LLTNSAAHAADTLQVCSPSGKICVKVWMAQQLSYSITHNNKTIVATSAIDLLLDNNSSLSFKHTIKSHSIKKVNETITSPIPEERQTLPDVYHLLSIPFRPPYKVEFRAYDDGVAYRIITKFKDSITVENELAEFPLP